VKVYGVEAPGKQPAFLLHEWSCGGIGCSVRLALDLYERSLEEIDGLVPCAETPESRPASVVLDRRIRGKVFNANANASTGVERSLTLLSDGVVTSSGSFDNKNLFGAFEARGGFGFHREAPPDGRRTNIPAMRQKRNRFAR
jgi:hypothetical protein